MTTHLLSLLSAFANPDYQRNPTLRLAVRVEAAPGLDPEITVLLNPLPSISLCGNLVQALHQHLGLHGRDTMSLAFDVTLGLHRSFEPTITVGSPEDAEFVYKNLRFVVAKLLGSLLRIFDTLPSLEEVGEQVELALKDPAVKTRTDGNLPFHLLCPACDPLAQAMDRYVGHNIGGKVGLVLIGPLDCRDSYLAFSRALIFEAVRLVALQQGARGIVPTYPEPRSSPSGAPAIH